jgi:hypothetical protein
LGRDFELDVAEVLDAAVEEGVWYLHDDHDQVEVFLSWKIKRDK